MKDKRPKKVKNPNIIRKSIAFLYVGLGGTIVFLSLGLFIMFAPERMIHDYEDGMRLPVFFIFLVLCIPYVYMILLSLNWKIEIGKGEFIFVNIWKRKRKYKFSEVEIKSTFAIAKFYCNGKHIVGVNYYQENWTALENAIMTRSQRRRNRDT